MAGGAGHIAFTGALHIHVVIDGDFHHRDANGRLELPSPGAVGTDKDDAGR